MSIYFNEYIILYIKYYIQTTTSPLIQILPLPFSLNPTHQPNPPTEHKSDTSNWVDIFAPAVDMAQSYNSSRSNCQIPQ